MCIYIYIYYLYIYIDNVDIYIYINRFKHYADSCVILCRTVINGPLFCKIMVSIHDDHVKLGDVACNKTHRSRCELTKATRYMKKPDAIIESRGRIRVEMMLNTLSFANQGVYIDVHTH